MRKTLSDIVLGGQSGFAIEGLVDVIVRNPDGSIDQHERKKNLITDTTRIMFSYPSSSLLSTNNIFIHQNSLPIFKAVTSMRSVISGTYAQAPSSSVLDGPNRLWTFTTTFAAPPSNRTFQTIGLCKSINNSGFTNLKLGPAGIMAATVLGTPINQSTIQTAEIVYRIALTRT